jgi:hypothetical protein
MCGVDGVVVLMLRLPRTIRRAMIDAKRLLATVEFFDLTSNGRYGLVVIVHVVMTRGFAGIGESGL